MSSDIPGVRRTAAHRVIPPRGVDRRTFLKTGALTAAAVATRPEWLLADPYAPLARATRPTKPVRIRGVVRASGRGLAGVPVSDGLQVVDTDRDGTFELISSGDREFVWARLPAGHAVPRNAPGTARFYEPIDATRDEMSVAFDFERLRVSDERHTLLLLGDIQTEDAYEMNRFHDEAVPDIQATLRELGDRQVFGISDGDIMYDRLQLYPEYERGVARLEIPFFQVIGNHDLDQDMPTDEDAATTFSRHFGPCCYSFDRGLVHYVVLDDVFWHGSGYIGYIDDDALTWLAADLARVEPGAPVIVATHIPVLGGLHTRLGQASPDISSAVTNRDALYRLLEPFDAHILTGHTHECEHIFEQGTHEHVTGAICGAWWSGPICWDGTPNGYCVYEADGTAVTWRYKATGHDASHQMRLYPPGADPTAPDDFVANVWNWDPEWTVRWFADGEPRGIMGRRPGLDPLSVDLQAGEDLPPRRPWVDPRVNVHMFYAPLDPGAREVRVEAIDRFGRTWSETLRLD